MQTSSISPGRKRHVESVGFTQSQKGITASDFKEFKCSSSSKKTDSNMASLVFRPKDSDTVNYPQLQSMSINSNHSRRDSQKRLPQPRSSEQLAKQGSHPSFGGQQQQQISANGKQIGTISGKWANIAEKCALKMITRDLYVQLSKISDIFSRRLIQQELILSNQSHMQLKSFLEISMSSSQSNMAVSLREQQVAYSELSDLSMCQLQSELSKKLDRLSGNLSEYFRGESEILQTMAQEKERNAFLEAEISAHEDRIRPAQMNSAESREEEQEIQATEHFISELETQLQQARSELLSSKLTISDQNVEIEKLKVKNDIVTSQVNQFLEERRNFEESFENLRQQLGALQSEKLELSQMIRDRESTLGPAQLQSAINYTAYSSNNEYSSRQHNLPTAMSAANFSQTQELKKQLESMKRQIFDATKKQESLQVVENTLLEKLDKKELEVIEIRETMLEAKHENQMKSDVITKAQKIIERMTQKSESDEKILKRLNEEKEDCKREIGEKSKSIQQLSDQLNEARTKQSHEKSMMRETMTRELEEVRSAVRDYQVELGNEKQSYEVRLSSLQEELQRTGLEKQQLQNELESIKEHSKISVESANKIAQELQEQLRIKEASNNDLRAEMKKQVDLVEDTAKNHIKYLQTRIKEIVEETNSSSAGTTKTTSPEGKCHPGGGLLQSQKLSLVTTLKKDFEGMCKEVIAIREALRAEGNRRDAMVNQKITKFEEFKHSVLDQLLLWDEKTAELSGLAERYSGALEEQKRLFLKLKLVVQEKDQVITELYRQLAMREHSQEQHFEAVKVELERSNELMVNELLTAVSLLEQKVVLREKELLQAEEQRITFRREYAKILEERNYFEKNLKDKTERLKHKESELESLQIATHEREKKQSELLNIHTMHIRPDMIEIAIKNSVDDAMRYQKEMVSYRDQLYQLEKDRNEERILLNQKVNSLEEQYAVLSKQAIDKEEEQQLDWAERETQLVREAEQSKIYADKIEVELQTRERQLKKIQDKIDDDDKRLQDAKSNIEIVAEEKMEALAQQRVVEEENEKLNQELEQLQDRLRQQEEIVHSVRREVQKEQRITSDKMAEVLEREKEIKKLEDEILGLNQSQEIHDSKMRAVEGRNIQTSKDLQDLYQELQNVKLSKLEVENAKEVLAIEIQSLQGVVNRKQGEVDRKDEELHSYQKTVMRQTRELEKNQGEAQLAREQKQRLKAFDGVMQEQAQLIEQLRSELRGPDVTSSATQTVDSGMLEIEYARQEVIKSQRCQEAVFQENVQLKEALQRSSYEVCRLIEDKRELEDLIEKLNRSIGMFRQQQNRTPQQTGRGGFIATESLTAMSGTNANSEELMGRMLAEKENYISGLENEISEMRKEIEIQREQLLQAEAQTIEAKAANQSTLMSYSGRQNHGTYVSQPYQPSSPRYLYNAGFSGTIHQSREPGQRSGTLRQHRSSSRDRYIQNDMVAAEVPQKLQPTTMNYSTLSRSLTPVDNFTGSDSKEKHSGYFNNVNNSQMGISNNQTQASAMLNQTHYNSQGGIFSGIRPQDNASYLNPNQSSVMMNYHTANAMNQSVLTNERSMWMCDQKSVNAANAGHMHGNEYSVAQISGLAHQGSPPGKDNSYSAFIPA